MSRTPDTISTLRDVLGHCRTIAVVGLSPQWHRPSYFAAKYMQSHGYRIIPVNPLVAREDGSILGERCFASVVEAAQAIAQQGGRIDLVDCFRKSDDIPPLAEEAIAIGARCLPSTPARSPTRHRRARAADLPDHQLRVRQRRPCGQPVQPADLRQRLQRG
jgi:predicted CoA-binding protein